MRKNSEFFFVYLYRNFGSSFGKFSFTSVKILGIFEHHIILMTIHINLKIILGLDSALLK